MTRTLLIHGKKERMFTGKRPLDTGLYLLRKYTGVAKWAYYEALVLRILIDLLLILGFGIAVQAISPKKSVYVTLALRKTRSHSWLAWFGCLLDESVTFWQMVLLLACCMRQVLPRRLGITRPKQGKGKHSNKMEMFNLNLSDSGLDCRLFWLAKLVDFIASVELLAAVVKCLYSMCSISAVFSAKMNLSLAETARFCLNTDNQLLMCPLLLAVLTFITLTGLIILQLDVMALVYGLFINGVRKPTKKKLPVVQQVDVDDDLEAVDVPMKKKLVDEEECEVPLYAWNEKSSIVDIL